MQTLASLVQLITRIKRIICSASSVPLQESAAALFSQEEKWTIQRHAPFKDYISEAPAFNRRSGGSETVTTQKVCDHRGFKDMSALQAIEHVRTLSEGHQLQLCWRNVFCMAAKSKECTQGAVCIHTYLQKPNSLSTCTRTQHPAPNLLQSLSKFKYNFEIPAVFLWVSESEIKVALSCECDCSTVQTTVHVCLGQLLCSRFTLSALEYLTMYNISYYTSFQALCHLFVFAPAVLGCIFP